MAGVSFASLYTRLLHNIAPARAAYRCAPKPSILQAYALLRPHSSCERSHLLEVKPLVSAAFLLHGEQIGDGDAERHELGLHLLDEFCERSPGQG